MEKTQKLNKSRPDEARYLLWDCESSLYDSFELNSFKRQLHSAISSRSLSMPHLSYSPAPPPPPPPPVLKRSSKISRSIQKLLRSLFRTRADPDKMYRVEERSQEGFYFVYDRYGVGALTTIPEVPETFADNINSPEFESVVKRSASARFPATSIGISCT